ncbi:Putative polyribitolphosphotransferase [Staphylococcus aureus]|nr:Putative polyribitolphosphotransferase [Staphylococcus aureus]
MKIMKEKKSFHSLDKHFKYQDGRSSERLVRNLFGS